MKREENPRDTAPLCFVICGKIGYFNIHYIFEPKFTNALTKSELKERTRSLNHSQTRTQSHVG